MDNAARRRWIILLCALCATVGAIFYPVDDTVEEGDFPDAPRSTARKAPAAAAPASPLHAAVWVPLVADPFAPRVWEAPPPPPPVAVVKPVQSLAVAEVVTPPAGPPALPFQFVGQMNDSQERVVYLARGEQAMIARAGEVLEGTYKVLEITALQIEFEHLPTGQKQALVFPAQSN